MANTDKQKPGVVDEGIVIHNPDDFVLEAGETVGDYRVECVLGQGGMGTVYKVRQPMIGKEAALKVIHRSLVASNSAAERLIQEARAVNAIGHENIVDIFAFGSLPDGRPYLVMELLEGVGLDSMLTGTIEFPFLCRVGRQICGALEAAHKAGVVHRDLKPENIFIQRSRTRTRIKLLDFGIAKVTGDQQVENLKTDTGFVMGTPQYIAPEQAKGRNVGPWSDVYSLGVMLFELITGKLPFDADSSVEIAYMHIRDPAPDPTTLRPDVPPALAALVLRMLEKDPDDRPSLAEIDVGLRVIAEDPASSADVGIKTPVPTGKQEHFPAPDTVKDRVAKTEFVRAAEIAQPVARRSRALYAVVGLVVVAAAALSLLLIRSSGEDPKAQTNGSQTADSANLALEPEPASTVPPKNDSDTAPPALAAKGKVELSFNVDSGLALIHGKEYPFSGGKLELELPAGEHRFEIKSKGRAPYAGQLVAAKDSTVKLGISLKKTDAAKAKAKAEAQAKANAEVKAKREAQAKAKARARRIRKTKARNRNTRKREGRDDSINPFE